MHSSCRIPALKPWWSGTVSFICEIPELCPTPGKLAGSQPFVRGVKETLLTKEKGKLTWALSHGLEVPGHRIGITDPQISLVYSAVFGGLAPLSDFI